MAAESASPVLRGFPVVMNRLVGRERERAAVAELFRRSKLPLLTLTGPAGTGKTRLAISVASDLAGQFADGVVFVSLASITDPALVLPTIADALELWQSGEPDLLSNLVAALRERELLLVLDNVEQVVGSGQELSQLLNACPRLRVLATSRVPLRLHVEQEYLVPPLALPEAIGTVNVAEIAASEAVALFVQRARAVNPTFALTEENAPAVLAVCRQLDGLPLAIELAAARVKVLSPQALLARLGNRLQVLTGGARDAPSRLRSMREAVAWSYDLLDPAERALFRRLAVFVGGFTLEAAERVVERASAGLGDPGVIGDSVFDGIASLVDKCLLHQGEHADGEPRFRMLETIREFGIEQLELAGEAAAAREAHAAYFSDLAERCHPEEASGIQQRRQLDLLEADHDNLRAALIWLNEQGRGVGLAGALGWFWYLRGHLTEGRAWLERALHAETGGSEPVLRARALRAAGKLAWEQADFDRAVAYLEENRALSASLDDRAGVAHALLNLGVVAEKRGDDARASDLYEQALAIFRAIDDRAGITNALIDLGDAAFRQGDLIRSEGFTAEALALSRQAGDPVYEALSLSNAGQLSLARGEIGEATVAFRQSLALAHEVGNRWLVADAFGGLAGAAAAAGEPELGARWLGAARAMCDSLGTPGVPHHAQFDRSLAAVRARLEEAAFEIALAAGRGAIADEVVREGIAWEPASHSGARRQQPAPAASEPRVAFGLTDRELEVLNLLVAGHSSRAIGEALFISPRTASTHVGNILAKLGVNTRSAAVAVAFQNHLV